MPEHTLTEGRKALLLEQGHNIISSILSYRWACEQAGIMVPPNDVDEAIESVKFIMHHIENQ